MDHTLNLPPLDVPGLLHKYGLHPDKRLGQNFLIDDLWLRRIVSVAEVGPQDAVLEIGAGIGNLTRYLAQAASQVVAVEVDGRILPALREVLAGFDHVHLVQGDILALDPIDSFPAPFPERDHYLVVANIPYYITSAVIRHLLESDLQPNRVILTIQREVADRICAEPGDMSLLALSVQVYGNPVVAAHIPAGAFYPVPKVDSAILQVHLYDQPRIPPKHLDDFFNLAKAGFGQKRKTLRNALAGGLHKPASEIETALESASIDPRRRAETLSIEEWGQLVDRIQT